MQTALSHDSNVRQSHLERAHRRPRPKRLRLVSPAPAVGDRGSYAETMVPHLRFLRVFALKLTGNRHEADDLVQETCLKAIRAFHQFEQGTSARAWMRRILQNTFLSQLRDRRHREEIPPDEDLEPLPSRIPSGSSTDPHRLYCIRSEERMVASFLERLSEKHRSVLRLHLDGFTYKEIAEALGLPMGTVMSRLYRARREAALKFYGAA